MALPHIVVSAALLLLGAQPSHHHFPHPGRICAGSAPELGFQTDALIDSGIYGNLALDGIVVGFPGALVQHEAPTVALLEPRIPKMELTGQLLSSDLPGFWTPVRYGSLTVEVRVPISAEMAEAVEHVVLLLDNRPLDPTRYSVSRQFHQMFDGDLLQISYRFDLPCPPPGKHILQARYKVSGLWSSLSAPLHFDVRLPDPPQIVAISDCAGQPLPIRYGQTVSITKPSVKVQLAQINHNETLVAYVNGKPILPSEPDASCCRTVWMEGHITPGIHRLTVRTVHSHDGCSITSEPSNEVVFHYYDEDVYLLKPGTHCNNRCYPFVHPPACVVPAAAPTPSSSDSRTQPLPPPQNSLKSPTPLTPSAMKPGGPGVVMARPALNSVNELCDDMLAANRWAENMEELADREEAKADACIRAAEAEMRINRAAAITGPPSPFYFAAPAHFPIRGFGSRGDVIERPGAVIYEDMVFSFDRDGNYNLRFSILIPELPTTLHLQLQLQPHPAGPWHTITLPPQQFRPDDSSDGRPQPKLIRDYVVEGRSEILHRCYGEMGQDATIRRTGSARFGYGFDAMRQATAY
jgi:hypothetical protein